MSSIQAKYAKFGTAIAVIVVALGLLAYTGVEQGKSYYVTIAELRSMGPGAFSKRLRVGGFVQPGSIRRHGTHVEFTLMEQTQLLPVVYNGIDAPPDTFKDDSQTLAEGSFGHDGVFRAQQLQAKCASRYVPEDANANGGAAPTSAPAKAGQPIAAQSGGAATEPSVPSVAR